ncbi:ribbon-helix-helix domain-containing protein [Heyndrickxia coagulans]|uniref:CopG family ribbon-helix-helix protein n=1 Tax=Heyndrickxia coagulans TaxID=1398 RepID=UPI0021F0FB70|nr:ribbon-helix-helix domain-containing protein [Heyndrickxia coagulans]UYM81212.1 ribbon-helix-helix domain-containing protein [Heyndrickxia coagulans]
MKRTRQYRIDQDLLDRFDRVNEALRQNKSEVIRQLMRKYVEEKEEELKVEVLEIVELRDNFPNNGEAYAVGKAENGNYFFAWGPEYPYADEVPSYNVDDGESGIGHFPTKKHAMEAMKATVDAWETNI